MAVRGDGQPLPVETQPAAPQQEARSAHGLTQIVTVDPSDILVPASGFSFHTTPERGWQPAPPLHSARSRTATPKPAPWSRWMASS